jgi:hypothetical protein
MRKEGRHGKRTYWPVSVWTADTRSYEALEGHLSRETSKAVSQGAEIILFPALLTTGLLAMAGPKLLYGECNQAMVQYVAPPSPAGLHTPPPRVLSA